MFLWQSKHIGPSLIFSFLSFQIAMQAFFQLFTAIIWGGLFQFNAVPSSGGFERGLSLQHPVPGLCSQESSTGGPKREESSQAWVTVWISTGKMVLGKSPGILLFRALAVGHAGPPSEKLSPACWFCLAQGSKVLYIVCKQVEPCQKHLLLLSLLFLTENYYRTLNFG